MKSIHSKKNQIPQHIEYQPIIDRDPNDCTTIYTTLLQCIKEESPRIPVITFDLPIWMKAVDITRSKGLKIIPRLGGFHLSKSFLDTFRSIFADSGLRNIIQLIYPGNISADSILNGNSYDKAIRAHFLIDAAIVQHIMPPDQFSDDELMQMKNLITDIAIDMKVSKYNPAQIAELFQERIERQFKKLKAAGRILHSGYYIMIWLIQ